MNSNKLYALILAREGSKGIKNKNLKEISGKSLLEFSIITSKNSKSVDQVFVSSDSKKYLDISSKLGATPVLRSKNFAKDSSSSEDAILHFLNELEKRNIARPTTIILVQCTSPFTSSKDIDDAFKKFQSDKLDSLFSGTDFHGFIWDSKNIQGINHNEKDLRKRRQDVPKQILENGAFYIFNTNLFLQFKNRFFGKTGYFLQDKIQSFEIDDIIDLDINNFLYKKFIISKNKINKNNIHLIVSDFDGVLTDNTSTTNNQGKESVLTNKADSLAISLFKKQNPQIPIIVLTSEKNKSVLKRCKKLKVPCYQISSDKGVFLEKYLKKNKIKSKNVIYIGNDKNDISCLNLVGYPIVVSDSDIDVIEHSFLILNSKGGKGAIKELLNMIK